MIPKSHFTFVVKRLNFAVARAVTITALLTACAGPSKILTQSDLVAGHAVSYAAAGSGYLLDTGMTLLEGTAIVTAVAFCPAAMVAGAFSTRQPTAPGSHPGMCSGNLPTTNFEYGKKLYQDTHWMRDYGLFHAN